MVTAVDRLVLTVFPNDDIIGQSIKRAAPLPSAVLFAMFSIDTIDPSDERNATWGRAVRGVQTQR